VTAAAVFFCGLGYLAAIMLLIVLFKAWEDRL
jgi:hypothetical protein